MAMVPEAQRLVLLTRTQAKSIQHRELHEALDILLRLLGIILSFYESGQHPAGSDG